MTKDYYATSQTVEGWVESIENKFHNISVRDYQEIADILGVTSPLEIDKIKKAQLIIFGKRLGVLSFEDACKKLGHTTVLPISNKFVIAGHKLSIIAEAINEGWVPKYNNEQEYRYVPVFNMRTSATKEMSFDSVAIYWTNAYSVVSSHLCYKSNDLAYFIANYFIDLYQDYMSM